MKKAIFFAAVMLSGAALLTGCDNKEDNEKKPEPVSELVKSVEGSYNIHGEVGEPINTSFDGTMTITGIEGNKSTFEIKGIEIIGLPEKLNVNAKNVILGGKEGHVVLQKWNGNIEVETAAIPIELSGTITTRETKAAVDRDEELEVSLTISVVASTGQAPVALNISITNPLLEEEVPEGE